MCIDTEIELAQYAALAKATTLGFCRTLGLVELKKSRLSVNPVTGYIDHPQYFRRVGGWAKRAELITGGLWRGDPLLSRYRDGERTYDDWRIRFPRPPFKSLYHPETEFLVVACFSLDSFFGHPSWATNDHVF